MMVALEAAAPVALPRASNDGVLRPYPRPATARLVSYSELSSLDCWLKHHYGYVERLRPVQTFAALRLGSAWDGFQNAFHDPGLSRLGIDERLEFALDHATAELAAEERRVDGMLVDKGLPRPFDWQAQLQHMHSTVVGMALAYVERYGADEDWASLGTQVKFEVPFPSLSGSGRASTRYRLHGVLDRVSVHLPTGRVYVIDAKLKLDTLTAAYREGFDNDLQLPLYGWAMQQLGLDVAGGLIDAASAQLPRWPQLKAQPEPVPSGAFDESGKSIALTEPEPCKDCNGSGVHVPDGDQADEDCARCAGEGVERFASGARKGEVKQRTVKRPALYSDAHVNTTLPVYVAALDHHGLPHEQYAEQIVQLTQQWVDDVDTDAGMPVNPFHWRHDLEQATFTDAQLERAITTMQLVGPMLDKLPPAPMPTAMKCRSCRYRVICPSTHPADAAEHFTTPADRDRVRDQQAAADAAALAACDDLF